MNKAKRKILWFVAASSLLASTVCSAQNGFTTPEGKPYDVTIPMEVTGFDKAVAAEHGYEILADEQGIQYSAKIGATRRGAAEEAVAPANRIGGNCGYSWLYYDAIGHSAAQINTGFQLKWPAVSYYWKVNLRDAGGSSSQTWGGGLFFRSRWGTSKEVTHMTHGHSEARVSKASSVILSNGAVCTSGGPWDSTNVY